VDSHNSIRFLFVPSHLEDIFNTYKCKCTFENFEFFLSLSNLNDNAKSWGKNPPLEDMSTKNNAYLDGENGIQTRTQAQVKLVWRKEKGAILPTITSILNA
jgi:hypothetical protein